MKKEPEILERIDSVGTGAWINVLAEPTGRQLTAGEMRHLEPTAAFVRRMVDEELAELFSRETGVRLGTASL